MFSTPFIMSASHIVYLKFGITSANTVFSDCPVQSDLLSVFTAISSSFPLCIPLVLGVNFWNHRAMRKLRNILDCTSLNFWVLLGVKTQKWSNTQLMWKGHTSIHGKHWPTAAIGHVLCSGSHGEVARKRNWIWILEGIPRLSSLCFRIQTHYFCESDYKLALARVTPFTEVTLRLYVLFLLSLAHTQQHF